MDACSGMSMWWKLLSEHQFQSLHHRSQGVRRQAHNSESERQYRVKGLRPLIRCSPHDPTKEMAGGPTGRLADA